MPPRRAAAPRCAAVALLPAPASAASWQIYQGTNDVKAYAKKGFPVDVVKGVASWQACRDYASNRSGENATIFTWHDAHQGQWSNYCVLRLDGVWHPAQQKGHVSGVYGDLPPPPPPPPPPPASGGWDCAWRRFAFEYARRLQPERGTGLVDVFDALQLGTVCGDTAPQLPPPAPPVFPLPTKGKVLYVDWAKGDDAASGAEAAPLRTLAAAVARAAGGGTAAVVLRAGRHYVPDTVRLTPAHSGLTIMAHPGEDAWVAGGRPLTGLAWRAHDTSAGRNVWVANVDGDVRALRVGGQRAIPARFPNADPERDAFPVGYIKQGTWWGNPTQAAQSVSVDAPNRSSMMQEFTSYTLGIGGTCDNFDPPVSYWCSSHVSGGGAGHYTYPKGLTFKEGDLPRRWGNWTPASGAELHVWRPHHWANWMYEIDGYDYDARNISLGRGGFQGARGNKQGAEWFVSHVFDELDAPAEYFHDAARGLLYLYHNGTGAPPADADIVAVTARVLLAINASQAAPVRNVTVRGVGFRDAAPTYLDPHGVPSGGDWALQRSAAVFVEGSEGFAIDGCRFERVDGNGVMLSGYNRDAAVSRSDFKWTGDTAMAAWGVTDELGGGTHGFDGTGGDFPLGTRIVGNIVRELGIYEKQSSMWFQAKAARTFVSGNLFFNGPRAGINFNDGFGGGDEVSDNLIFNTCRESGDHGPINSWDRQPFLTTVRDGTPSIVPADRRILRNFIVSNYQGTKGVDNDDGSSYYQIYDNFMVGGWMHKSNFGGHSKDSYGNVGAYATMGMRMQKAQFPDYVDGFFNNTVVFGGTHGAQTYIELADTPSMCPRTHCYQRVGNNTVYAAAEPTVTVPAEKGSPPVPLTQWLAEGYDHGTTWNNTLPADAEIVEWGRRVLRIE